MPRRTLVPHPPTPACLIAPEGAPAIPMRAFGTRGYHVSAAKNKVEVRMYKREYKDPNELLPTDKVIKLDPLQLNDLAKAGVTVQAAIGEGKKSGKTPPVFIPLGAEGLHLSLTTYCDQLLVHLRYFERCFWDPTQHYPTKNGITLKVAEMEELISMLPELSAATLPQ